MDNVKKFYEKNYKKFGIKFQRSWPNEELIRFLSRNFSHFSKIKKKKIKILETGCGSGGNLWMLSKEGYKTFGLDISFKSIELTKKFLKKQKLKSNLLQGNMINIPFKNNFFDVIVDVFSSCCLSSYDGEKYLNSCFLKLKKNGIFFSYFPSKKSTMFKNRKNIYLDKNTLFNNINVKTVAAYRMNNIPLRFLTKSEYCKLLKKKKNL